MDGTSWWQTLDAPAAADLVQVWIPVGLPGFQGDTKARRQTLLDERFGRPFAEVAIAFCL